MTSAISTQRTMKIQPHEIEAAFSTIGMTIAVVSTIIEIPVERGAEKEVDGGEQGYQRVRLGFSEATHAASAFGIPVKAMHGPGTPRPRNEENHAGEPRRAPDAFPEAFPVEPTDHRAIASAPTTPNAADSVAGSHKPPPSPRR